MIFKPELVEKILAGRKWQTRRPVKPNQGCRYCPGRTYAVQPGRGKKGVARIKVHSIRREKWADISTYDAAAEGFADHAPPRDGFWQYIFALYPDLDVYDECWVIEFSLEPEGDDE